MTQALAASSPRAPDMFRTMVETTAGCFEIEVHRNWSPHGADRFYELARLGYYDDSRFFRVVAGKWVQFGIAGEPAIAQEWRAKTISDDRPGPSNRTGFVAFANTGPDTRSTQVFVNLRDNSAQNDPEPDFAPFGKIVHGMDVVEKLYGGYGETSGGGMRAGNQDALFAGGNRYLDTKFPNLDRLCKLAVRSDDFVDH
jgi:peptidyl-prolyl cis-trans isomerase A (cyclophilin A)